MTVLVLAQDADSPADQIVLRLAERGAPVFRVDLSSFPSRLSLDAELREGAWQGVLTAGARSVELAEVRSIWYRDPSAFRFPDGMSDVERAFAHREARLGLGGVLAALPVLWVNHPNRSADAMYKPVQLATAVKCGLEVPPTLVTNRAQPVSRFASRAPLGVVGKTFGPNSITEDGILKIAYTHRLAAADLDYLRGVEVTAHQIQHWVDKDHEARVVVVGEQVFGVAIAAHSDAARVDWRADFGALSYELVDVPRPVETAVRRYMREFGLNYAVFDFCIDHDGRWVFLESNSSGQYAWLEAATEAPISAALADLLVAAGAR